MNNHIKERILNDEEKDLDIEKRIIKTVANSLNKEEEKISLESEFINDLKADSLDVVELMMAIESEFGCDIPDDKAVNILTVSDAVEYVKNIKKHINV